MESFFNRSKTSLIWRKEKEKYCKCFGTLLKVPTNQRVFISSPIRKRLKVHAKIKSFYLEMTLNQTQDSICFINWKTCSAGSKQTRVLNNSLNNYLYSQRKTNKESLSTNASWIHKIFINSYKKQSLTEIPGSLCIYIRRYSHIHHNGNSIAIHYEIFNNDFFF